MSEDFTAEALAYLCDELAPAARAAFAARLARDPAAAADFKALSDALAAHALAEAPEAPLSAAERGQMAVAILRTAEMDAGVRPHSRIWRYGWPAAAAILLALNVGQWARMKVGRGANAEPGQDVAAANGSRLGVDDSTALTAGASPSLASSPQGDRADHGGPAYFGPATLTGPGVAPAGFGLKVSTVVSTSVTNGLTVATMSWSATALLPAAGAAGNSNVSPQGEAILGSYPRPAFAWSTFDPLRRQGLIELHRLPFVPANHMLRLWVRPEGSDRFIAVGEVPPQFYGQSGSIAYKLGEASDTPAQILIMLEPRRPAPIKPAGTVVLAGPSDLLKGIAD